MRPVATLALQDQSHIFDALDSAVERFTGPGQGGGGSGGGLGGGGSLGSGSIPYSLRYSREGAIGVVTEGPVRLFAAAPGDPALSWQLRTTLGAGSARWLLPEGAGIFVDPITVRSTTTHAEADLRLVQSFALLRRLPGDLRLDLSGGGGLRRTHSDLALDSALIRVRDTTRETRPYLAASAALGWGPKTTRHDAALRLEIRRYRDTPVLAQVSLDLGW